MSPSSSGLAVSLALSPPLPPPGPGTAAFYFDSTLRGRERRRREGARPGLSSGLGGHGPAHAHFPVLSRPHREHPRTPQLPRMRAQKTRDVAALRRPPIPGPSREGVCRRALIGFRPQPAGRLAHSTVPARGELIRRRTPGPPGWTQSLSLTLSSFAQLQSRGGIFGVQFPRWILTLRRSKGPVLWSLRQGVDVAAWLCPT